MLACSSLCYIGMNAQEQLVKEVEKEIEATSDYDALRKKIAPALVDETSKNDAYTWYVAGKLEMKAFDELYKQKLIGQNVDVKAMGSAILSGIDYMIKALPLDSVPEVDKKTGEPKIDKKTGMPKIKAKYSGKIINTLAESYTPIQIVTEELYNGKDYKNAIKGFDLCANLPFMPFMKEKMSQPADTIVGYFHFFKGNALWLEDNPKDAIGAYAAARKHGYLVKPAFDYAIQCANNLQDFEAVAAIAKEALPIHGKQDDQYVRILINYNVNTQNYAEAERILDQAINDDPQNAEFVNLKGILIENAKSIEEALPYFKQAVDLDPNSSKANFDLGRYYFNKAVKVRDERTDLTGEALSALTNPLYEQALPYLEKAYELDKENTDAKNALRNIYYQLGNEEKLNAIEAY